MIYRRPDKKNKSAKAKPGEFLNNNSSTDRWHNIMANYEVGGATWPTWSVFLEKFITECRERMELCPDGTKRFPAHISVIVLDNLNGTNLDYASQEEMKKEEQRTMFDKFKKDVEKQDAISHIMSLLDQFRSAV